MGEVFDLEKKYLQYTEKIIETEIKKSLYDEESIKKDSIKLSFEDRLRGTHLNLNSRLCNIGKKIEKLEKSKKCPYFGRIDYQKSTDNKILPIYIGRSSITHNDNIIVYDWRSPICSLYYDSEVGPVVYNSLSGIQSGKLLLKRGIIIKNGQLISTLDSNLVTDDKLLLPYLNDITNSKMKTIIASIQKEQNSIIRTGNEDMIVQGVAGSGKTSVALHRIAYLIYTLGENVKSNDFLVIGPNDYFLNYISSVLPDLETTPVEQKTLLKLMNDYIDENFSIIDELSVKDKEVYKKISSFKGSLEYRDLIDDFIKRYLDGNEILIDDFKIDDKVVFSADMIKKRLLGESDKYLNFDKVHKYYKSLFKETKEDIYYRLNAEYKKMYTSLPKDDPLRKIYVEKSIELEKLVKKQGEKLLDKYFKSINKSCLSLYISFISELDNMKTSLNDKEIKTLQKDTLKSIRKKQISFEDIPSLLYLNYKLTDKVFDYRNVVIDEGQDYSIFTYYVLKKLFKNAKFNIYGDLTQSIYPYRSVKSWEDVNKRIFNEKCNLLTLSKSYRTTTEITENANNVLKTLDLKSATPVIRHGADIKYFDNNNDSSIKTNKIHEWLNLGYKTIAIICKDESESKKTQDELINMGINSKYISGKSTNYSNGVFVLSVATAKGLEFDCTIINDASSNVYDADNDVDMHLLYVASTRALHEQVIMYNNCITKPFESNINKNKVLKKVKN